VVASAGIGRFGQIETISEQDFDDVFATNVKGSWLWAREVVPSMKAARAGQVRRHHLSELNRTRRAQSRITRISSQSPL